MAFYTESFILQQKGHFLSIQEIFILWMGHFNKNFKEMGGRMLTCSHCPPCSAAAVVQLLTGIEQTMGEGAGGPQTIMPGTLFARSYDR
jgi:hypothetical protein